MWAERKAENQNQKKNIPKKLCYLGKFCVWIDPTKLIWRNGREADKSLDKGKKLKISYFGNLILDNNSKGEVDFFQAETFNTT